MLHRISWFCLLFLAGLLVMSPYPPIASAQTGSLEIAYVTDSGGVPGLAVMAAEGTNQRRLIDLAPDETPTWSPDGTQIAYIRLTDTGARELAVYDFATQSARVLTNLGGTISHPAWSPTGAHIAFSAALGGPADVYTIRPDGTNPVNVTAHAADDRAPSWNPDGSRLVFQSNRDSAAGGPADIYTINLDGSDLFRLTTDPGADAAPVWSPEGMRIAFVSSRDGNANIFVIDFNGTNLVRLSDSRFDDSAPSWSPDGVYVTFVGAIAPDVTELFVANADGISLRQLTVDGAQVMTPAWSPDGDRIAFASNRGGTFDLYTLAPDGTGWAALTSDPAANLIRPVWGRAAPAAILPTVTPTATATQEPPTITPVISPAAPLVPVPSAIPSLTAPPPTLPPTPTLFASRTPMPPTPQSSAELTLVYDPALPSFFLVNTSGRRLNLANMSFSGGGREVSSSIWLNTDNLSASLFDFPPGGCLGLWGLNVPVQPAPGICTQRHGWWSTDSIVFWAAGSFTVLNNGAPVANCASDAFSCNVDLDGPPVAAAPAPAASAPVAAPPSADILLTYDAALPVLYLTNISGRSLDLSPMRFEGNGLSVLPYIWSSFMTGDVFGLRAGGCLGIWGLGIERQIPPAECGTRLGWLATDRYVFWSAGSFNVIYGDTVLTTCSTSAGRCEFALP